MFQKLATYTQEQRSHLKKTEEIIVVAWMSLVPINSQIRRLAHQGVNYLKSLGGVAFVGRMCHWGWALRLQKSIF